MLVKNSPLRGGHAREKFCRQGSLARENQHSDHFAWGVISANPYAIRALEKATRRRCSPVRIRRNIRKLATIAAEHVPYVTETTEIRAGEGCSIVNTHFFVDHSSLPEKLAQATSGETPWLLGNLEEGWEWLAFTFHDQSQISLTTEEITKMLEASDQVTRLAYARMLLDASHHWAQHSSEEAAQVLEYCQIAEGARVLDFGCGVGRHLVELATRGVCVIGVDYVEEFVARATQVIHQRQLRTANAVVGDCREIDLGCEADAVVCLYDVIGSYADKDENIRILKNIAYHLKPGGRALISVMNGQLTERRARHWFFLQTEPDKLLELPASRAMENTGDIFDPEHFMIDRDTVLSTERSSLRVGGRSPSKSSCVTDDSHKRRSNRCAVTLDSRSFGRDS